MVVLILGYALLLLTLGTVQVFYEGQKTLTKYLSWFDACEVNVNSTERFYQRFVAFLKNIVEK